MLWEIPDEMVDHNWIRRVQQRIQPLRNLSKFHARTSKYLLHVLVTANELSFLDILWKGVE